ncbi:MAG: hypothetical protein FD179_1619 [Erysipelotrichaceae bacterium]|nr:MAG: hypothetical protein FD179_1619 [Erysipelotrichaceae bacterium]
MIKLYKYSYYTETARCVAWLEELALQGWIVEKFTRNLDFVRLRRDEHKRVHYYFYFNENYDLDEEGLIQSAKEQGWINLNKNPIVAGVFLFMSTEADPSPLETDEQERDNMYRTVKRKPNKFFWSVMITFLLVLILNIFEWGLMFIFQPGFWVTYTILFWTLEFFITPKRIKRRSEHQRRILSLTYRVLRFSIIPMWVIFITLSALGLIPLLAPAS